MGEVRDLELERLLREGIPLLYAADEAEFADAEPQPVPPELRERILGSMLLRQISGMMAAAEARSQGVKINGWEPSQGSDVEHYYLTPEELDTLIATEGAQVN